MRTYLQQLLECPACHGELKWTITAHHGDTIETAVAHCMACNALYPVQEGIAIFLTPDLPREDLWEDTESQLSTYLREHPDVERQLMEVPLEKLSPADQFYRSVILNERGKYGEAKAVANIARTKVYTPEFVSCMDAQVSKAIDLLATSEGPIVDLASGMGHFVEAMANELTQSIVASDFSPRVLRRDHRRLEFFNLHKRVDLLAFDARRTPLKDGSIKTLTTYQGLANIRQPGELLRELRRIVSGIFLVLTVFYPEDDEANASVIADLGLSDLLFRRSALDMFFQAGWEVEVVASCFVKASPTPAGVVLEGASIDTLPVNETILECCILIAK